MKIQKHVAMIINSTFGFVFGTPKLWFMQKLLETSFCLNHDLEFPKSITKHDIVYVPGTIVLQIKEKNKLKNP